MVLCTHTNERLLISLQQLHDSYEGHGHLFVIIMWYCLVLSILTFPLSLANWQTTMDNYDYERKRETIFRNFKGRLGSVHGWLGWQLERISVSIHFYSAVWRMRKYARSSNS